jgi:hypothetical protein
MTYTAAEAREELLDGLSDAIERIGVALAELGAAYELLDEQTGDRLEEELFGPVQRAYGRAKRTYASFAESHGMAGRSFDAAAASAPSTGPRGLIDNAIDAAEGADAALAELQDAEYWAEVGDVDLRAGITNVRQLLGEVPQRGRLLERTLGR